MRIIKKRDVFMASKNYIKCMHCGSIIEYGKSEEKVKIISLDPKTISTNWYIKCPVCRLFIPTHSTINTKNFDWRLTLLHK